MSKFSVSFLNVNIFCKLKKTSEHVTFGFDQHFLNIFWSTDQENDDRLPGDENIILSFNSAANKEGGSEVYRNIYVHIFPVVSSCWTFLHGAAQVSWDEWEENVFLQTPPRRTKDPVNNIQCGEREQKKRGRKVWIDEASSLLRSSSISKSPVGIEFNSGDQNNKKKSSSPVLLHNKTQTDLKPLSGFLTERQQTSLSVHLLSVSVSVSWSVLHRGGRRRRRRRGGGSRTGAVRTPCPALSSSGWPELSGRWASRSDRPLRTEKNRRFTSCFTLSCCGFIR